MNKSNFKTEIQQIENKNLAISSFFANTNEFERCGAKFFFEIWMRWKSLDFSSGNEATRHLYVPFFALVVSGCRLMLIEILYVHRIYAHCTFTSPCREKVHRSRANLISVLVWNWFSAIVLVNVHCACLRTLSRSKCVCRLRTDYRSESVCMLKMQRIQRDQRGVIRQTHFLLSYATICSPCARSVLFCRKMRIGLSMISMWIGWLEKMTIFEVFYV